MVKGVSQVFAAGPPVVKRALGVAIDKEDLGGSHFRFRAGFGVDLVAEVSELYQKEIEDGIGATGIKAGLIKCATGEGSIKPYEEGLLRAASRAQKATGVPIITHTDHGSLGDKQLEIFFSEGVKPDRIGIGHSDDRADLAYHTGILDKGAFLSFDRFGLEIIFPNKLRIASLIALLGSGYEKQMLISHDTVNCWRGRPLPSAMLPAYVRMRGLPCAAPIAPPALPPPPTEPAVP